MGQLGCATVMQIHDKKGEVDKAQGIVEAGAIEDRWLIVYHHYVI
jgi:hypothetical protein